MLPYIIAALCAAVLSGCGDTGIEATPPTAAIIDNGDAHTNRFAVQSFGQFYAGYYNHRREVLVITDTKTGVEYLAITGCGTTELFTRHHGKHTEMVEE